MRGLTLIVATGDAERFRAALTLAAANAALGGRTRVFCHERAAALLAAKADPQAAELRAAGLPDLPSLIETTTACGVVLIACQTGLALAGLAEGDLPAGAETGGMVGLLAALGEDRLGIV